MALAQGEAADTTRRVGEVDTTQVVRVDTAKINPADTVTLIRKPGITDSLLNSIYGSFASVSKSPDRPQATSIWQFDPNLYRVSISMWGDFETFYPLGLAPSHLSRANRFSGEQSFANPVPYAYSEDFNRSEPADRQYFLTPALAGLVVPFGRTITVYQQSDLIEFDTARSTIYVNRGRGAFANTTFEFMSHFGKLGSLYADGTYQKTDGLVLSADSRVDRMRFVIEPNLGRRVIGQTLYSFSRTKGRKIFFPDSYFYSGFASDNFTTLSSSLTFLRSQSSQIDWRLNYKNHDQKFNQFDLRTAQRYRLVESSADYTYYGSATITSLGGSARYLRYTDQGIGQNAVYYEAHFRQMRNLSDRFHVFASGEFAGASDVGIGPSLTGVASLDLSGSANVAAVAGLRYLIPTPEMLYSQTKQAGLVDSVFDYRISGDESLESGTARSLEFVLNQCGEKLQFQIASGMIDLKDAAEWSVNADSVYLSEVHPTLVDRNILYATLRTTVQLHSRINLYLFYGVRSVESDGVDVLYGPQHTAGGFANYRFPIGKMKLWFNVGAGGTFRSANNQNLYGGPEEGVFLTEGYLSFDLKRFHFYFNYHNIFDQGYTQNGIDNSFGRSVFWGFRWTFIN